MKRPGHMLIRARFMLPMGGDGGRAARIEDGYVLTEGERILEAGRYTDETGGRILASYKGDLLVVGARGAAGFRGNGSRPLHGRGRHRGRGVGSRQLERRASSKREHRHGQ